jgi:hypothetical protein
VTVCVFPAPVQCIDSPPLIARWLSAFFRFDKGQKRKKSTTTTMVRKITMRTTVKTAIRSER